MLIRRGRRTTIEAFEASLRQAGVNFKTAKRLRRWSTFLSKRGDPLPPPEAIPVLAAWVASTRPELTHYSLTQAMFAAGSWLEGTPSRRGGPYGRPTGFAKPVWFRYHLPAATGLIRLAPRSVLQAAWQSAATKEVLGLRDEAQVEDFKRAIELVWRVGLGGAPNQRAHLAAGAGWLPREWALWLFVRDYKPVWLVGATPETAMRPEEVDLIHEVRGPENEPRRDDPDFQRLFSVPLAVQEEAKRKAVLGGMDWG